MRGKRSYVGRRVVDNGYGYLLWDGSTVVASVFAVHENSGPTLRATNPSRAWSWRLPGDSDYREEYQRKAHALKAAKKALGW